MYINRKGVPNKKLSMIKLTIQDLNGIINQGI